MRIPENSRRYFTHAKKQRQHMINEHKIDFLMHNCRLLSSIKKNSAELHELVQVTRLAVKTAVS